MKRRQIAFRDMQVSTANAARQHAQQHPARTRLWTGHVLDLQQLTRRRMAGNKNRGFHGRPKPYPPWRQVPG
jgi:hypothetical protein